MGKGHNTHIFYQESKMIRKRSVSLLLIFCMLFTFVFTNIPYGFAEDTSIVDMDALAALGIDTSAVPDGFDENDTSNPYGKNTVTINPVEELHVFGLDSQTSSILDSEVKGNKDQDTKTITNSKPNTLLSRIYGHEDKTSKTTEAIMNEASKNSTIASGTTNASGFYRYLTGDNAGYYLQLENYEISTSLGEFGNIAATKIAKGNFDGNEEGKTAQTVLIYTGEFSQNGGLYMRIGDAIDAIDSSDNYGSAITLIPTNKSIGNPKDLIADVEEDFATDPYLMQNYLQVTTGDYDGDGIDEIAVFIPELNGSRIVVYKLKSTTGGIDYKNPGQWSIAWTYSLSESGYVSNMVSLVSGDFNQDGIDDLGVTWGYYYGPSQNKGSNAVVMFGAKGNMLQKSQEFLLKYSGSDIIRGSFIFGDLVGSGEEVLILGGQLAADINKGNLNSRYIGTYTWNGTSFVPSIEKNFDLFEKDSDANYVNGTIVTVGRGNKEIFYSSPANPANLAVIKQGLSEAPYLYLDSLQIQYTDSGLKLIMPLDIQTQSDIENPVYYVEYGATSGDMIGLGYETLVTMQQTLSRVENIGSTTSSWYYKNWLHRLFNIRTYESSTNSVPMFVPSIAYMNVMDFGSGEEGKGFIKRDPVDYSTSICMQNTDEDTSYLQYTGKHYFTYSDPQVLAVLASPPYFSDLLGRDDLSGNYGESATSYSSTKGQGGGDTFNTTIEAGVYVAFEQEFSVFGVKVASVEAEVAVTAGFTYETESTSMLEQTISYRAASGEDMIAFFSIPLEIYEYTAYTSNGDGTYTQQAMTVNIPRTAAVEMISLDSYEDIAKDYDVLPKISGAILKHTIGNPLSYPSSEQGYSQPLVYGQWARVGYSSADAGITQEIAMTKEESKSYNFSGKIETKAGAGAGGVTVGVTVGAEVGGGWVDITTSGNSFSGEINNMPEEAREYGYSHVWKIFSYLYDNGGMKFPVVNYLVDDVKAPPPLPEDFEQNVEKTTDSQIAFTWTYDKMVAGFQIYRYYEFPDGSGSYELKFIPMTDGVYSDGVYKFEFIDEDLSPYTDYQYQIQTVRASVPNNSIPSEVVSGRTKTDVGYPQYTVEGLDTDGRLRIYPDSESTVKIIVENAEDYTNKIGYQWQKYVNGVWTDINGRTWDSLTFRSSGVADQAIYRCRTNVVYYDESRGNNYYISAYSPEFSTLYSKREAKVVGDSFKAINYKHGDSNEKNGLKLNINLISGNSNHFAAPTGNVVFTVQGTDYNADFTVPLKPEGTLDGQSISNATVDVENLPDGVYEISAYYSGSRVFKSLMIDKITTLIGNSGYQLLLQKDETQSVSFTYGDQITPILKQFAYDGEDLIGTPVAVQAYELYQLNETHTSLTLVEGKFPTPDVGRYVLRATLDDGATIEREFTVSKRDITVKAEDRSDIGKGLVETEQNKPKLKLESSSTMAFNQTLDSLQLEINAKNTAGNVITLNNSTDPGNYTIIGRPSVNTPMDIYNNYNVTFTQGIYTIIGTKYDVVIKAEQYKDMDVGTISLSNSLDGQGGAFSASTELLFFATPYIGYEVDSWSIKTGNTTIDINPSWLNSSKTRLAYTMKDEPITVTVSFKKSATTLEIAQIGNGNIKADDPAFVNDAIVATGAEINFTATPDPGYSFKEWQIESSGSSAVRTGNPNGDGSNTLNFTMGDRSTTIRAVFVRDSYTITLSENLEAVYIFDDGSPVGIEMIVSSGAKIQGDTEVLVRVKAGYGLADNAQWLVNREVVENVPPKGYEFEIKGDTSIAVDTVQQFYTISTISNDGSISVKVNEQAPVSDTTIENVAGGSKVVFTAIPDHGYAFEKFTVTETDKFTENNNVLTINELGADITVEAEFTKSTDYKITVNYGNRAQMNYILYDSYNNEVEREIVDSGRSIDVVHGDKITLIVSTNTGYMVDKWTVNGIVDDTSSKTKTLENISGDMNVNVDIISQISYTVTYSEGNEGGNISSATSDGRSFVSGDKDIGGNSKLLITADPDAGKMIDYWTFNGETVLNEDGEVFVGKILTIENLRSSTSTVEIKVYFTEYKEYSVTYDETNVDITEEFIPDDAAEDYVRDGAKAVFTIEPKDGYRIVSADLNINEDDYTLLKNPGDPEDEYGTWTLTVPRVESNLTITAVAKKIHKITIQDVMGGSLDSTTTTSYPYQAIEGEKVILEQNADLDHRFLNWNVKQGNNSITVTKADGEFSFIMPEGDVSVSAGFARIEGADLSIKVHDTNLEAPGGYNGTISVELDRESSGYPIVIASSVTESVITDVYRAYTDEYTSWPGTIVNIFAEPDADYRVLKWTVNGVVYTNPLDFPVASDSMNQWIMAILQDTPDLNIVVQFEQIGEKINYGVDGGNGKILSVINESSGMPFISGNTVTESTTLTFTAEADAGYEVEAWLVDGTVVQDGDDNTFQYDAEQKQGARITVKFGREPFSVSYSGINGEVSSDEVISGGSVRGNTSVTFTATANPGYKFDHFSIVGGTSYTSGVNPLTIPIVDNTVVIAHFVPFANSVINYNVTGGNGRISATKDGLPLNNGGLGAGAETIIFTANPDNNYKVKQWIVDGETIISDANTYNLQVSKASHTISVEFERSHYVLSFNAVGNGTITGSSNGNPITPGFSLLKGSSAVLTAVPDAGYQVKGWQLNGSPVAGSSEQLNYSLNNMTSDTSVTVEFEPIPKYTVDIAITGTGIGTIKAYINGVEASIINNAITVNNHDKVLLIATPKDEYNNASWTVVGTAYELGENSMTLLDVKSHATATVRFGVAELITVEAYARSEDANPPKGRITVKAGYGNNLEPLNAVDTTVNVTKGKTVAFTAVPEDVYMVQHWKLNDILIKDVANTISLVPETNIKAEVFFEPILGYRIPTSGVNYTITSLEKLPDDVPLMDGLIRKNGTVVFTVSPEDGYYLKELKIFGVDYISGSSSQGSENIVTVTKDNGDYIITIERVNQDIECAIAAEKPVITIKPSTNGTITASYKDQLQTIPVNTGDMIPAGVELTLKAIANSGYQLSSWGDFALGKGGNEIKVIVPQGNFTVSASFVSTSPGPGPSPGPSPGPGVAPSTRYTIHTVAGIGGSISPKSATVEAGGNQDFAIIPQKGFEIRDVLVNGKSIGAVTSYTFRNVREDSTIEAIFAKIESKPDPSTKIRFIDVNEDDWFADSVAFVVGLGLFKGTSENEFSPKLSMTRGMFVTVLGRLYEYMEDLSLAQPEGLSFEDVPLHMYYAPSVQWASENGIINGYQDGEFKPDESITREQIVAIIHRFAAYAGLDTDGTSDLIDFSDHSDISPWALEGMKWAVNSEIIGGRTDGTIDPQGLAQRSEVAAIIHRFLLNFIELN